MGRQKKQHLKQRKDGRFVAVYHGHQFMGRTEAEALAARQEYMDLERDGMKPARTVQDFALEWLPISHPRSAVSDSTYTGLAIHLEKLVRQIGDLYLDQVTPLDIKEIYSKEYDGLSNSYIKAGKQLFCALFDAAQANGLCQANPARNKTSRPHKGTIGGHRAITDQERGWIETLCSDHRAHPAAIVMLYAGLRPQEVKALNIDRDVDFVAGTITLNEFVHLDNPYEYKLTSEGKTTRAKRTIPLFQPVRTALEGRHGYIVTRSSGQQINVQAWKSLWASYRISMETAINGIQKRWYGRTKEHQDIIKQGGSLPPWIEFTVTPYDLRHSFCKMCRDADPPVELNTCIHWMGHSDAKMILQVYDQYTEERGKQEAKKVEKWISNMQVHVQPEYPDLENNDNP